MRARHVICEEPFPTPHGQTSSLPRGRTVLVARRECPAVPVQSRAPSMQVIGLSHCRTRTDWLEFPRSFHAALRRNERVPEVVDVRLSVRDPQLPDPPNKRPVRITRSLTRHFQQSAPWLPNTPLWNNPCNRGPVPGKTIQRDRSATQSASPFRSFRAGFRPTFGWKAVRFRLEACATRTALDPPV